MCGGIRCSLGLHPRRAGVNRGLIPPRVTRGNAEVFHGTIWVVLCWYRDPVASRSPLVSWFVVQPPLLNAPLSHPDQRALSPQATPRDLRVDWRASQGWRSAKAEPITAPARFQVRGLQTSPITHENVNCFAAGESLLPGLWSPDNSVGCWFKQTAAELTHRVCRESARERKSFT
jgi:hypothetical protein